MELLNYQDSIPLELKGSSNFNAEYQKMKRYLSTENQNAPPASETNQEINFYPSGAFPGHTQVLAETSPVSTVVTADSQSHPHSTIPSHPQSQSHSQQQSQQLTQILNASSPTSHNPQAETGMPLAANITSSSVASGDISSPFNFNVNLQSHPFSQGSSSQIVNAPSSTEIAPVNINQIPDSNYKYHQIQQQQHHPQFPPQLHPSAFGQQVLPGQPVGLDSSVRSSSSSISAQVSHRPSTTMGNVVLPPEFDPNKNKSHSMPVIEYHQLLPQVDDSQKIRSYSQPIMRAPDPTQQFSMGPPQGSSHQRLLGSAGGFPYAPSHTAGIQQYPDMTTMVNSNSSMMVPLVESTFVDHRVCNVCGKRITRDMSRHMRTHQTISRFTCKFPKNQCRHKSGRFNRPYDFKKHLLNRHFKFDNPEIKKLHNLSDKLDHWGTCPCGFRFLGKDWLDDHILVSDPSKKCPLVE